MKTWRKREREIIGREHFVDFNVLGCNGGGGGGVKIVKVSVKFIIQIVFGKSSRGRVLGECCAAFSYHWVARVICFGQ